MASRGRPESLARAVQSLVDNADNLDQVEIIVGCDDDDKATWDAVHNGTLPKAKYLFTERPPTLHHVINRCVEHSAGDWLVAFGDDYVAQDFGWDRAFIQAISHAPDGAVLSWDDPSHPRFPSLYAVPRKWLEYMPFADERFPFWWSDTGWSEIRRLTGLGWTVATTAASQSRGKTQSLREIGFWSQLFEATRPEREQAALAILQQCPHTFHRSALEAWQERLAVCQGMVEHWKDPLVCKHFETALAGASNPRYDETKRKALALLNKLKD